MKSINTLIFRHFFLQALLPILVIEFSLIVTLFLLNNYQSEQNKKALEGIADEAFVEIARQTASRINQHFTQAGNALIQLSNTSEIFLTMRENRPQEPQNYQYYDGFFQYAPPHVSKNGFFRYMQPKSTTVYTTNRTKLTAYDYSILNALVPLTPISKAIFETPHSLVTNIWINIGEKYAFAYPPINPKEALTPTLDVTKFDFYYGADPQHNPQRLNKFIPLYQEDWAIQNGELGTFVHPIYLQDYFMGVAGFTLNVKEVAKVINALELPFEARAMLLDTNNTLIASSNPKAIKEDFDAHSFYEMHKMEIDYRQSTMHIDPQLLNSPHIIQHSMPIEGTDLKFTIYVQERTIFAPIDSVSAQTVQVGIFFIIGIALFYLFFFWFNFISLRKLAHKITYPLKAIVTFSSQLGRKEHFHLNHSNIKELESLNDNLNTTHQELLDMLIKDKESGLFNRTKLSSDLKQTTSSLLAVLHIHNYRTIMSYYGQESAYALLEAVIKKLQSLSEFHCYRISDNELAILLPEAYEEHLNTLLKELNAIQLTYNTVELHPFVYAGVAPISHDGSELEKATLALHNALEDMISTPIYYQDSFDLSQQIHNNLLWAGRLKDALSQERIKPYFQPIYNLQTNKIEKFEALVRIEEDGKAVSPRYFLESAEKMGRIHEITLLMIQKVYAVAARYPQFSFSINLSFKDLQDSRILNYILEEALHYKIQPQQIVFELLETQEVEDPQKSAQFFVKLKKAGFSIAIDDFGTGHSNFANLTMMEVDFIKIDGQFIKNITQDDNAHAIAKSIHEFAKVMGAKSIAEFVKDEETLKCVRTLGINYAQGFVISPAVSEQEIDSLVIKVNGSL